MEKKKRTRPRHGSARHSSKYVTDMAKLSTLSSSSSSSSLYALDAASSESDSTRSGSDTTNGEGYPSANAKTPWTPMWMPMWMPMPKVVFWMSAWYLCSLGTLFMNKVILTRLDGRAHMLGIVQMTMTAALGAAKVYLPVVLASHSSCCGNRKARTALETGNYMVLHPAPADKLKKQSREHHTFWRDMVFVGVMRGATVLLGLVSLSHVAVSFVETIKASAPLFTVFFAQWMLGEVTPAPVVASLFPVMIGLVMCSATEMSFDTIGFVAAVSNNCIDCVQNVFSKRLLSTSLSPVELQFYTSAAAVLMQFPVMVFTASSELAHFREVDRSTAMLLLADGLCFHMQSVTAYFTMSLISPVSQSVANTVKRSLLIVISIWYFGNEITVYSAFGMACVCVGVALYNSARLNVANWSTVTSQAKEAVGSAVETEMLEETNGWEKGRALVQSMRKGRDDGIGTRAIVV